MQEGSLAIVGPKENITPAVVELVRNNKAILVAYLEGSGDLGMSLPGDGAAENDLGIRPGGQRSPRKLRQLDFSLFYFGNACERQQRASTVYDLLLRGAAYADLNGYSAVWVPERHFDEFGGLYPSPATLAAALAVITKNIGIRAGSVVVPLHHPVRIAEDWSVVDNLSGGRVGIACASGWHPNDFVLAPENYLRRREVVFEHIGIIQQLWRGEKVAMVDGGGAEKSVRLFPRPVRAELPVWITSAGKADTFASAGRTGAMVLTHLLGENLEQLEEKIRIYRKAYHDAGHPQGGDKVALMLHTYVGENEEDVLARARKPFISYLRSSLGLMRNLAASLGIDADAGRITAEDLEGMLDYAFTRYISHSSLIGGREKMIGMLYRLSDIGVDEVACLIDFGIDERSVMKGLEDLTILKDTYLKEVNLL